VQKLRIKGYPVSLCEQENLVVIYDYQNKLEKMESVSIMLYLEEEGFLDEFGLPKENPIKVQIQKIKL
jgi:hypothetical protein